jgi:hypothetical protein
LDEENDIKKRSEDWHRGRTKWRETERSRPTGQRVSDT